MGLLRSHPRTHALDIFHLFSFYAMQIWDCVSGKLLHSISFPAPITAICVTATMGRFFAGTALGGIHACALSRTRSVYHFWLWQWTVLFRACFRRDATVAGPSPSQNLEGHSSDRCRGYASIVTITFPLHPKDGSHGPCRGSCRNNSGFFVKRRKLSCMGPCKRAMLAGCSSPPAQFCRQYAVKLDCFCRTSFRTSIAK